MRLLRAKAARKTLGFYRAAFKLEAPYTLLVDGTFVHHALATVQTNLRARVEKVLGRGVRFAVPAAVLDELRSFGAAAEAAAQFCSKHCEVLGAPGAAGAADAVLALLGEANERKFVVATHDDTLQALRNIRLARSRRHSDIETSAPDSDDAQAGGSSTASRRSGLRVIFWISDWPVSVSPGRTGLGRRISKLRPTIPATLLQIASTTRR